MTDLEVSKRWVAYRGGWAVERYRQQLAMCVMALGVHKSR